MSPSLLLLLNRASGTGHGAGLADELAEEIRTGHAAPLQVETKVVDDHAAARAGARDFVASALRPAVVVAAGGGGTLRAVVEGVMDAFPQAPPLADVVRLAGLRIGSGNVVARRLGVSRDPLVAARQVGEQLRAGRTRACAVLRCSHGLPGGGTAIRHAVTMCGLGQWGRVPGDISRWRERHAAGRRRAASVVGLERVNLAEYLAFGTSRMLAGTVFGSRCDLVEIDGARPIRLLAAVALNLPLAPLPDPGVALGDEAAGLIVVPRLRRPVRRRLEPGSDFSLRFLDRNPVEFFLDEDPELASEWLRLEVAGCLTFVPGGAD